MQSNSLRGVILWYNRTTAERKLGVWTVSKLDYGYAVAPMTRPPPPLDTRHSVGLSAVVFVKLVEIDHVMVQ